MKDCTPKEVYAFDIFLKSLASNSSYGITPNMEAFLIKAMDNSLSFMSHLLLGYKFQTLTRLSINKRIIGSNKRIYNQKYLKYPPKELVNRYGRCNLKQQSILYATFGSLTALSEMKPLRGDLITMSTWEVIDDSSLIISPILRQPKDDTFNPRIWEMQKIYEKEFEKYPPNIRKQINLLNEFIADEFTKPVKPDNDRDYLFSAYFADRILNKFENGDVEALYYPSVPSKLSFENLAIKPKSFDKKYRLIEVKESVIDMDHTAGQGGTMMLGIGEATKFDYETGDIFWNDDVRQPQEQMDFIIKEYGYEL